MAEAMGKINTKMCFMLVALALIIYGCSNEKNSFGPLRSAHNHADIKVYILGNAMDFSLPQYQLQDKLTHFEDWDGDAKAYIEMKLRGLLEEKEEFERKIERVREGKRGKNKKGAMKDGRVRGT